MLHRTAGFVSKKPHKKSRRGCLTCKKKRVKCDEVQPVCTYCSLRRLSCVYAQGTKALDRSTSPSDSPQEQPIIINDASPPPPKWLVPAANTSLGQLTKSEWDYLHYYKGIVLTLMEFRQDETVYRIHRDCIPKMAISKNYLLYAILSIAASHSAIVKSDARAKIHALQYGRKALETYSEALSNITSENYETLLLTAMFMMALVPPPDVPCDDAAALTWMLALFNMMQGLRILASLKWSAGIERLTVYPLFRRELRKLPPPPMLSVLPNPCFYTQARDSGSDPQQPNPPQTYQSPSASPSPPPVSSGMEMTGLPFWPQEPMSAGSFPYTPQSWKHRPSPAFLPPLLMDLLKTLVGPQETSSIDLDRPTLVPALHALSPIFLSLYYYRLNEDLYVRIIALPTFLPPEFFKLIRHREPRALVVVSWWLAFVRLIPGMWWLEVSVARTLQAVSSEVMRSNDKGMIDAMQEAYQVFKEADSRGVESAAKSVFEGWEGVNWEEGPQKEEEWSFEELIASSPEG